MIDSAIEKSAEFAKKQETFKSRMDEALDAAEEAVAHAKEMEEELPEESEDPSFRLCSISPLNTFCGDSCPNLSIGNISPFWHYCSRCYNCILANNTTPVVSPNPFQLMYRYQ